MDTNTTKQMIDAVRLEQVLCAAGVDAAAAKVAVKGVTMNSPELLAAAFRSYGDAINRKQQRAAEKLAKETQKQISELAAMSNTFTAAALQPGDDPRAYSDLLSEDELREIVENSRNSASETTTDTAKLEAEIKSAMGIFD